ncbi:ATP-binding protein [Sphingomonas glacialis]|uniref:histidine kinase n=1 Tax=Sphingomonas glacialis TaxID=658225 RepID=A0A502FY21_9SPHN|nr:ATP-binding protein [Sphingomonas glacialis]TPG54425.1 ATPase [Sphingomonas glacialis]
MLQGFGSRTITAIGLIVVAAIAVFLLAGDLQPALVTLVGGIAAALVATGTGDGPIETPRPVPAPAVLVPPETQDVIEAIVEPVLIVAEGRVTHANAVALGLLGKHIVGEDVRVAIRHPGAAERLAGPAGETSQGPINLVGLGTLDQHWEMHVSPAARGQRIVQLVDRTGNYAAERMRVDFVANASHELRTPLASILGYIETLGDDKAGEDAQVRGRFLKIMFDEARRMQRLVEDLISLSRIEAEKYRLPDRAVDVGALIGEVRSELLDAQDKRSSDIVADIDLSVPAVAGDRAQLSQVLHNLIGNAMKYGRAGTPVTVKLWRDPAGMVRISVTDEGEGIAPEHLPRLTERFYRVDPGRSRAAGGTGLGLAIVKHIIERHRGRFDVASVVGTGTTVTILLPAHGQTGTVIKR